MAVRPEAYMKQGGMNRRKAGEDFYFLNKIMSLGGFGECAETTIYPSPRTSKRVPFGTGQAVLRNVETKTYTTYGHSSVRSQTPGKNDVAGWERSVTRMFAFWIGGWSTK